jgi:hypothetical protein
MIGAFYLATTIYFIVYALTHRKWIGEYKIFLYLGIIGLTQILCSEAINIKASITKTANENDTKYIYVFFEYFILLIYFFNSFPQRKYKTLLKAVALMSLTASIFAFSNNKNFLKENYSLIATCEASLMICLSMISFVQIFNRNNSNSIKSTPEFYSTTAIFFLFSFTMPLLITEEYINGDLMTPNSQALIDMLVILSYAIFFVLILIGIKCKVKYQKLSLSR